MLGLKSGAQIVAKTGIPAGLLFRRIWYPVWKSGVLGITEYRQGRPLLHSSVALCPTFPHGLPCQATVLQFSFTSSFLVSLFIQLSHLKRSLPFLIPRCSCTIHLVLNNLCLNMIQSLLFYVRIISIASQVQGLLNVHANFIVRKQNVDW